MNTYSVLSIGGHFIFNNSPGPYNKTKVGMTITSTLKRAIEDGNDLGQDHMTSKEG